MDVDIAEFWGGVAVVALTSVVSIIITFYKASKTSEDIDKQIQANNDNLDANIKASMASLEKTIEANIYSVEKGLKIKIGVEVLSKYRQEWINNLRRKASEFISLVRKTTTLHIEIYNSKSEYQRISQKNLYDTVYIYDYIKLLLNPIEDISKDIINKMNEIHMPFSEICILFSKNDFSVRDEYGLLPSDLSRDILNYQIEINHLLDEYNTLIQTILKSEWERVKKGE